MGIYLWHVIILYIAYYYDLFTSMGVYVQVCLMSGISLFLSILLTLLDVYISLHFSVKVNKNKYRWSRVISEF